jgi:outer membrane protein assembly factor BamB
MKKIMLMLFCATALTAAYAQTKKNTTSSVKSPALKWKFSGTQPFIASPAIDNGVVYVGGLDSTLYALDEQTGGLKWKFKTAGQIRSAVKFYNNTLIFNGGDGAFYCLDKTSGKVVWAIMSLGGILGERKYDVADYFYSEPLIHHDNVYIGSGDGRMYALNASTGSTVWIFQAGDIIHTNPVIAKERIIFGSSDGNLYALNYQNGQLLWKFKSVGHKNFPRGEMQGSPVVSGNLVFIGSRDYNLYAIDVRSGYAHWNRQFPLGWATALTATDSVLYTGTSDDKLFLALDPRTGKEIWKLDAKFNIFGPAAVSGANVYFGSQMGKLFAVNRKTGAINAIYTTEGYRKNRLNYFKEDDTFRDDIGKLISGFDSYLSMLYKIGAIYSTPAISDDVVVFSTTEGTIYCVSKT